VRLAQSFAIENDLIRADAIEAAEFPDLSARYRVYAVPRTVINGEAFVEGSLPEDFFLDAVLKAVNPETHNGEAL
jgi:alkyl hydroperoxide reductase subunit AhpF